MTYDSQPEHSRDATTRVRRPNAWIENRPQPPTNTAGRQPRGIAVFADLVGTIQCVLSHQSPGGHCGQQVPQRRLRGTPKRILPGVPQASFKLRAKENHVRAFQMRPQVAGVPTPQLVRRHGGEGRMRAQSLLERIRPLLKYSRSTATIRSMRSWRWLMRSPATAGPFARSSLLGPGLRYIVRTDQMQPPAVVRPRDHDGIVISDSDMSLQGIMQNAEALLPSPAFQPFDRLPRPDAGGLHHCEHRIGIPMSLTARYVFAQCLL